MSYYNFLRSIHPIKTSKEIKDDARRERENSENKTAMNNKILVFARSGNPGAKFKQ